MSSSGQDAVLPSLTYNCLAYSLFQRTVYLSSTFFITNFISSCPEEPPLIQGSFAQEMIIDSRTGGGLETNEHIEIPILTGVSSLSQEIPDLKSKSHYYSLCCNCPEAVWPVTKLMIDNKRNDFTQLLWQTRAE